MKLYRVTIEHTFLMVAENDEEAAYDAESCAKDAVRNDLEIDYVSQEQVIEMAQIPTDWRDACPYGEGGNARTCRDWLAVTESERNEK